MFDVGVFVVKRLNCHESNIVTYALSDDGATKPLKTAFY